MKEARYEGYARGILPSRRRDVGRVRKNGAAFCVLACFAFPACDRDTGSTTVAAQNEPAPSARALGSPSDCTRYVEVFCEKVGRDSPDCLAIKELSNVLPPAACSAGMAHMDYTESRTAIERKACTELMQRLCRDIGEETESCKIVRQRTPSFSINRCTAMLENYPGVLSDLKKEEAKNEPLGEVDRQRLVENARVAFGSPDAKVQLVEFADFQCPFCATAAKSMNEIKRRFGNDVYFVFRQFPLEFHYDAHLAAEASLAAAAQGKFWEYHDKLFDNPRKLEREDLERYAKELGLDMARFERALDERTYKAAVDEDIALGKSVNVSATPTLFLNGKSVPKVSDEGALVQTIRKKLSSE